VAPRALALAPLLACLACMPPAWGSNALLHPARRPVQPAPVLDHRDVELESDGLRLRGPGAGIEPLAVRRAAPRSDPG
jgi:hypothetical protein